jgi:hypothetical protein
VLVGGADSFLGGVWSSCQCYLLLFLAASAGWASRLSGGWCLFFLGRLGVWGPEGLFIAAFLFSLVSCLFVLFCAGMFLYFPLLFLPKRDALGFQLLPPPSYSCKFPWLIRPIALPSSWCWVSV